MNRQKIEFAHEMLKKVLENLDFQLIAPDTHVFLNGENPDMVSVVLSKNGTDVVFAKCEIMLEGGNILGSIMLELQGLKRYGQYGFFYHNKHLYVSGEEGNA